MPQKKLQLKNYNNIRDISTIDYVTKQISNLIFKKYKPIGIFNLAAETHVDRSIDSPEQFINSNILGTFNLFSKAITATGSVGETITPKIKQ